MRSICGATFAPSLDRVSRVTCLCVRSPVEVLECEDVVWLECEECEEYLEWSGGGAGGAIAVIPALVTIGDEDEDNARTPLGAVVIDPAAPLLTVRTELTVFTVFPALLSSDAEGEAEAEAEAEEEEDRTR